MAKVDILLATYNGSKYVSDQIESILAQTYQDWVLLIHDDGSKDDTVALLESYENKYPDKIELIRDGVCTGGAKQNFSHLLGFSKSDYIMFCDQDDIWLPQKIERTLSAMRSAETENPGVPILVHSDLTVVDVNLNVLTESMFKGQRLSARLQRLDQLLMCNSITGCTVMFNRELLKRSPAIPDEAIMHDWWLGCVTLNSSGIVVFVDEPLIMYRQHQENTVGYKHFGFVFLITKILDIKVLIKNFNLAVRQAKMLDNEFGLGYLTLLKIRCFVQKLVRSGL